MKPIGCSVRPRSTVCRRFPKLYSGLSVLGLNFFGFSGAVAPQWCFVLGSFVFSLFRNPDAGACVGFRGGIYREDWGVPRKEDICDEQVDDLRSNAELELPPALW